MTCQWYRVGRNACGTAKRKPQKWHAGGTGKHHICGTTRKKRGHRYDASQVTYCKTAYLWDSRKEATDMVCRWYWTSHTLRQQRGKESCDPLDGRSNA